MNAENNQNLGSKPFVAHIVTSQLSVRTILRSKLTGLAARGYRQIVIAGPDGVETTAPDGVKLYDVHISRNIVPGRDLRAVAKIKKILRSERPDIVHTRTAKAGFLGRWAAKRVGVASIVHTTHGLPYFDGQPALNYHLYRALERYAGRRSTFLLSQNRADFERLTADRLAKRDRAGWEGNGVDIGALTKHDAVSGRARVRAEFGVSNEKVLCVMLARLEPIKRVERFIQAVARYKAPDLHAVIAGDGPMRGQLEELSHRLGAAGRLQFVGLRSDPWDVLSAADIVCLTSDKEGLPRSIMEAMALRRAVVATDVPGTLEVVADGETGLLVTTKHTAPFTEALDRLASDPTLRKQLGDAGFSRVSRYFDEKDVVTRLDRLYAALVRGELPVLLPPNEKTFDQAARVSRSTEPKQ